MNRHKPTNVKKSIQIFVPLFVLISVMIGCKKHPLPPVVIERPTLLNISEAGVPQPVEAYEYNAAGLLAKRTHYANPGVPVHFSYDAGGKPILAKTLIPGSNEANDTYKFYYANGQLDRIELTYAGANPNNTTPRLIFQYRYSGGRLVEGITYAEEVREEKLSGRTTYTYDANGDVKTETTEERDASTNTYRLVREKGFEYDAKPNPLKRWSDLLPHFGEFFSPSVHNIARQTTVEGPNRQVMETLTRTYTYNEKGWPVTATELAQYPAATGIPSTTRNLVFTYQQ